MSLVGFIARTPSRIKFKCKYGLIVKKKFKYKYGLIVKNISISSYSV